ncbi:MAG: ABC transporter permease [Treponema sp.]|jgi:ABC-type dipeptide/oligopeptide/nickel transport system permease component|nr:ABC transporter permease [Treponema sp.]
MLRYALKRLFHLLPVFFGVTVLVFALLRLAPGDAARIRLADLGLDPSPEILANLREELGLNRPLGEQYLLWLRDVSRLDFGLSLTSGKPVVREYLAHLKPTAVLAFLSLILSLTIALPAGVFSALMKNRPFDHLCRGLAILSLSIPSFCLGLFCILLFSVHLRWLPSFGSGRPEHLVLPIVTLTLGSAAHYTRFIRGTLLEEFSKDYIRAARARGLTSGALVWDLALKNAAAPVITSVGMSLALLLGGQAVVEKVFSWPGAGKYLIDAILQRDYNVVQCAVILFACFFVGINLIADLLCMLIDPQIRRSSVNKPRSAGV